MNTRQWCLFLGMLLTLQVYGYAEVETRGFDNDASSNMQFVESPSNRTSAGSMGIGPGEPSRLDALQAEVQELRGRMEEQERLLQQFAKTQKQLYLELSRRVGGDAPELAARMPELSHLQQQNQAAQNEGLREDDPFAALEATAGTPSTPSEKTDSTVKAEFLYQAGYQLLKEKKYTDAEQQFASLIQNYPKDNYSASAYYWMGEMKLLDGNPQAAEREFKALVQAFPAHKRTADALLKLGMIAVDTKRDVEAKDYFQKIIHDFPESSAAQVAGKQLKKISA